MESSAEDRIYRRVEYVSRAEGGQEPKGPLYSSTFKAGFMLS